MHQRALALGAIAKSPLARAPMIRRLASFMRENPQMCWPDVAEWIRVHAPEHAADLADTIWATGDKSLRTNLLRSLDTSNVDERTILRNLVARCRAPDDEPELFAVMEKDDRSLLEQMTELESVPLATKQVLDVRLQLTAEA